jgi:dTDP-4-dehydrorhamnose reductase
MIIILGANGYVGSAYSAYLAKRGIAHCKLSRRDVDYTDRDTLITFLREVRATFLINCAGYTGKPNVDACELHKAECLAKNAVLPGIIRQACAEARITWGHVSSGCVFSGTRPDGGGFREDDAPNFSFRQNYCSFYSGSKALGEETLGYSEAEGADCLAWLHDSEPDCYVWRLRIPFNNIDNPRNYLTKLMRYSRLLDATNSLSQLDDFVRATFECWEKKVPLGIYNVTNPGAITSREVVALIEKSGVCPKDFDFFESEDEFMKIAAKTPRSNCVLDTAKLGACGIKMAEVHEAVELALGQWSGSQEKSACHQ